MILENFVRGGLHRGLGGGLRGLGCLQIPRVAPATPGIRNSFSRTCNVTRDAAKKKPPDNTAYFSGNSDPSSNGMDLVRRSTQAGL